ncbi:carboxypeptidase D [Blastomyces dermatitidis ER-3]|uniref:Carboxypeptidase n=2 Tax=Blastomyces TaxID=229219 RepID=A0A179UWX9_BLAGS|nr:carboxypeptidase D [Blastomyces gilchristii SLH14081]XP_045278493.1 carboxypeptidase D [Blastomyces dermatitidis ER-3]EEQ92086.2 carboxypeptidase D [Blastomyces dermatitidis ER-3]OAT11561.1 carboxypeptidase D [Blastomyces gilchristii SLH14081]
MRRYEICSAVQALIFFNLLGNAAVSAKNLHPQTPANPEGVKTILSPSGVQIRYKEPGSDGVCETTPGVKSYSGYVDLDEHSHMFFWFFEARHDPANAPVTLFLNGGPGSDSMIGLFQELGACNVTEDLETRLNPYAWNEVSNMLFLSQPLGVGFSYATTQFGSMNNITGDIEPETVAGVQGRFAEASGHPMIDTTDKAAVMVWDVLQGFYSAIPQLDSKIKSRSFNLWTESYGGHYGPSFLKYFRKQNQLIANGTTDGIQLEFNTLGIINGLVDAEIQFPYYPEFAVNNTYGIKPLNQSTVDYMKFSQIREGGCADSISACKQMNRTGIIAHATCADALSICRSTVEAPWYTSSDRGVYDIRHPHDDPTPPTHFINYLNQPHIQNALGVNLNYTSAENMHIFAAFMLTGDLVQPVFLNYLAELLDSHVRVALIYGDADYISNWFGGEAVSLQVEYSGAEQFRRAGYAPFMVGDKEYGATREYGNFSFTRVYDAGHKVPYYQPLASLHLFNRSLTGTDLSTGQVRIDATYSTAGSEKSTHLQYTPPSKDGGGQVSSSANALAAESFGVVWSHVVVIAVVVGLLV